MITETDKKYGFATDCRILALILHFLSTMSIVNKLVLTVRGQDIQSTNQKLTKASRDLASRELSLVVYIMFTFLIASRSEWFIGVICCNCPDVSRFFFRFWLATVIRKQLKSEIRYKSCHVRKLSEVQSRQRSLRFSSNKSLSRDSNTPMARLP